MPRLLAIAGVLLVVLAFVAAPANVQAGLITSHMTDQEMLQIMPDPELAFTSEGRIGDRTGVATFELDIGRTTAAPSQTAQYGWQSGVSEPFEVSYDAGTNTATFSLGGVTLTYEPDRYFNEVFVRTRATEAGSDAWVGDLVLEGVTVGDVSQAVGVNGTDILRVSGATLSDGFTLTGVAVLTWSDPVPTQSRLAFQIKVGAVPASALESKTWGEIKALYN
jgi:hypothetical protein